MTAYLRPGDVITLAVPDICPGNTVAQDHQYWISVYEPLGVKVHHVSIDARLTHPAIVAVMRTEAEPSPAQIIDKFIQLVTNAEER